MLRRLTETERRCAELAAHLERDVRDEEVDMHKWSMCIAGHAVRLFAGRDPTGMSDQDILEQATHLLGEGTGDLRGLFSSIIIDGSESETGGWLARKATRADAVARLRTMARGE